MVFEKGTLEGEGIMCELLVDEVGRGGGGEGGKVRGTTACVASCVVTSIVGCEGGEGLPDGGVEGWR